MTRRVKELIAKLRKLKRSKNRKKFIKNCDRGVIQCLCECVRNLLKGRLPLKPNQLKCLSRYKQSLRALSLKKTSLVKRKQILQKGGLIGALVGPLLGGLLQILTGR